MTRQLTVGLCLLALSLPFTAACKDKKAEEDAKKKLEEAKKGETFTAAQKAQIELRDKMLEAKEVCKSQLASLGLALIQYSNENKYFPHMKPLNEVNASTDVAKAFRTLAYLGLVDDFRVFTCPGSADEFIPRRMAVFDNPKLFQWKSAEPALKAIHPIASPPDPDIYKDASFNELSYTYLQRRVRAVSARSDVILAADRFPHHKNNLGEWGYNVLYGDGHVDFVALRDKKMLRRMVRRLHFRGPATDAFKKFKKSFMDPHDAKLGNFFAAPFQANKKGSGESAVGQLIGSVFGAKSKSNSQKCANNLRGIGLGLIFYSNEYRFFPHMKALKEENSSTDIAKVFRTLIYYKYVDHPEVYICPSSEDRFIEPGEEVLDNPRQFQWKSPAPSGSNRKAIASPPDPDIYKDLDFHQLSYTYMRKRMNSSAARSDTILAADRFPHHRSGSIWGYNVLYGDGHVDFVKLENVKEIRRLYRSLYIARPGSVAYEAYRNEHMK